MNCKPGDIAIIVRDEYSPRDLHKLVHVTQVGESNPETGEWEWICDSLGSRLRCFDCDGIGRVVYVKRGISIPDAWLRPIRDPGDDAVDETLLHLPAPQQKHSLENA